jgi:hypothetical protein
MDTLSDTIRRLQADGYLGNWYATAEGNLRCTESGEELDPAELQVDHVLRFEGQSDPGDMTILYALRTPSGDKGIYSAPFNADTPPEDSRAIARMPVATDGTLDL